MTALRGRRKITLWVAIAALGAFGMAGPVAVSAACPEHDNGGGGASASGGGASASGGGASASGGGASAASGQKSAPKKNAGAAAASRNQSSDGHRSGPPCVNRITSAGACEKA